MGDDEEFSIASVARMSVATSGDGLLQGWACSAATASRSRNVFD
jgi:hypothetical protein